MGRGVKEGVKEEGERRRRGVGEGDDRRERYEKRREEGGTRDEENARSREVEGMREEQGEVGEGKGNER
jgi:hypothetical protein